MKSKTQMSGIHRLMCFCVMGLGLLLTNKSLEAQEQVKAEFKQQIPSEFSDLFPGDIILIELNCQTCSVISESTKSVFSHSGLVLEASEGGVQVAQSLTKTEVLTLERFLKQVKPNGAVKVLRSKELWSLRVSDYDQYSRKIERLKQFFFDEYFGQPFDGFYLWDNVDAEGREILYCSEMVQKSLNRVLDNKIRAIEMDFSAHWDFWERYFNGKVPQGLPGNSPASLDRAPELETVFQRQLPFL